MISLLQSFKLNEPADELIVFLISVYSVYPAVFLPPAFVILSMWAFFVLVRAIRSREEDNDNGRGLRIS